MNEQIKDPEKIEREILFNKQGLVELKYNECIGEDLKKYKPQSLNNLFWNIDLYKYLSCITTINTISYPDFFKYVQPERAIGIGVQGVVLLSVIDDIPVVVKSSEDNIHELFVAMVCLNRLKLQIPNFPYIYGSFYCSDIKSLLSEDEKKGNILKNINDKLQSIQNNDWCKNYTQNYIIMEYIEGESLEKFVKNVDLTTFLSCIIQICLSLQMAYESCGFTHYDLHSSNIMVGKIDNSMMIPYNTAKRNFVLNTNIITYIIDYGYSSVNYENMRLGMKYSEKLRETYKLKAENIWPMYDLYRLLGSLSRIFYNDNKIYQFIAWAFLHFFNKNLYYEDRKQYITYDNEVDLRTHIDFIDFLLESDYKEIVSSILGIDENDKIDMMDIDFNNENIDRIIQENKTILLDQYNVPIDPIGTITDRELENTFFDTENYVYPPEV